MLNKKLKKYKMSVKKVKEIFIYYCQVCGWSISKKLLNEITGRKEHIKYCTECGAELIRGNIINDKEFAIKKKNYFLKSYDLEERDSIFEPKEYFPEKRIKIEEIELHEIYRELKSRAINFSKLREYLGSSFEHALYRGDTISESVFEKLKLLLEREIPYETVWEPLSLEENEKLAEMIGIILGDGHLSITNKNHYRLSIFFSIKEKRYINYVRNLMEINFMIRPQFNEIFRKNGSYALLRITNKDIVYVLISKGLKAGNKLKNQVGVPYWIKFNQKFMISCLRGLIDTDGTISPVSLFKTITIHFSNASLPLVRDFKEMCEYLGVRTSKIIGPIKKLSKITGRISKQYVVSIQAKDQVKKFIEVIQPKKWEYRGEKILRRIGKTYQEAFRYIESPYNLERAFIWKGLVEELGSIKKLIKNSHKIGEFTPTEKSFKIWMEKLLTPLGYQKWLKYNTNLIIDRENNQIQQFPQQLRILLCKNIYEMLLKYENENSKEMIQFLEAKINNSNLLRRLSFLLNNRKTRLLIIDYLSKLLRFVEEIKNDIDLGRDTNITLIKKDLDLPFHRSHIKEITEYLKKRYSS